MGLFRVLGQPNLNLSIDREKAARYGFNVTDVQDAVETAIGGKAVTQVLQGEQRFDLVVRYLAPYRDTQEAIENIRIAGALAESASSLAQLTDTRVDRRRFGNLSRSQLAVHRHQIQRARPRPGRRRRRSHGARWSNR